MKGGDRRDRPGPKCSRSSPCGFMSGWDAVTTQRSSDDPFISFHWLSVPASGVFQARYSRAFSAPDRRPAAPRLAGDRRVGKTAFPRRVDLASPRVGQVALALGHDSLHLATKGLSPPSGQFATSCNASTRSHPHRVLHFTVERGFLIAS